MIEPVKFLKVNNRPLIFYIGIVISLALLNACATPVSPSGGEPDRSGPKLIVSTPQTGTVQFSEKEVRFEFEDWVDRNSFRRAFSIEPGLNISYSIKWRRKTAIIAFESSLPDSTTIIFNIDTELRDTRSNKLTRPIRVAVSTGDQIDQGSVTFRVLPAFAGVSKTEPVVLLYREPFDLSAPAMYASSADTSGIVRFNYLSHGLYRAILVHDINRNRTWDESREYAQPMGVETFNTTEIDTSRFVPFFYAKRDTTRPVLQSIGLLSSQRLRVQFSKTIPYKPDNQIKFTDSTGVERVAMHLYTDPRESTVAYFQADSLLNSQPIYKISGSTLSDAQGNELRVTDIEFDGSSEPDTTTVRYISPYGSESLSGTDTLYIRYATVNFDPILLDSLKIYINREEAKSQFNIQKRLNRIQLSPNTSWNTANTYEIRTWNPATARYVDVRPRITEQADLGELLITVTDSLNRSKPLKIIMFRSNNTIFTEHIITDSLLITAIEPGTYHVVLFEDPTGSGIYDSGQVYPFRPPNFIYSDPKFPIRSRMTSEITIALPN
jgi:hypothetical protein